MRFIDFRLVPPNGGFHPAERAVGEDPCIRGVAIHQFRTLDDGTAVAMFESVGDAERSAELLAAEPTVHSFDIATTDGHRMYAHCHVDVGDSVARVFGVASLLAAGVVSALWVVSRLGLVPGRAAGPTLAATGVLAATGFASAVGGGVTLVVGGVAVALLVRDVGTYGTTLGAELGRAAPTRRTELVHAVGSVLVAIVGVGVAAAVARVVDGTAPALPVPVAGPLAAATVALVLLVLVLR
jgi:hypothetical protein